jgi:uncharacterized membrane protein
MLRSAKEIEDEGIEIPSRLFSLLILGIALVLIGIVVLVIVPMVLGSSGSVGVVILIGPIPIVFGSGPNASWLILIGIILAFVGIVLFLVMNRRIGRLRD